MKQQVIKNSKIAQLKTINYLKQNFYGDIFDQISQYLDNKLNITNIKLSKHIKIIVHLLKQLKQQINQQELEQEIDYPLNKNENTHTFNTDKDITDFIKDKKRIENIAEKHSNISQSFNGKSSTISKQEIQEKSIKNFDTNNILDQFIEENNDISEQNIKKELNYENIIDNKNKNNNPVFNSCQYDKSSENISNIANQSNLDTKSKKSSKYIEKKNNLSNEYNLQNIDFNPQFLNNMNLNEYLILVNDQIISIESPRISLEISELSTQLKGYFKEFVYFLSIFEKFKSEKIITLEYVLQQINQFEKIQAEEGFQFQEKPYELLDKFTIVNFNEKVLTMKNIKVVDDPISSFSDIEFYEGLLNFSSDQSPIQKVNKDILQTKYWKIHQKQSEKYHSSNERYIMKDLSNVMPSEWIKFICILSRLYTLQSNSYFEDKLKQQTIAKNYIQSIQIHCIIDNTLLLNYQKQNKLNQTNNVQEIKNSIGFNKFQQKMSTYLKQVKGNIDNERPPLEGMQLIKTKSGMKQWIHYNKKDGKTIQTNYINYYASISEQKIQCTKDALMIKLLQKSKESFSYEQVSAFVELWQDPENEWQKLDTKDCNLNSILNSRYFRQ